MTLSHNPNLSTMDSSAKAVGKTAEKFCAGDFAPEFIAESLLIWTMAGQGFEEIYSMIDKLF